MMRELWEKITDLLPIELKILSEEDAKKRGFPPQICKMMAELEKLRKEEIMELENEMKKLEEEEISKLLGDENVEVREWTQWCSTNYFSLNFAAIFAPAIREGRLDNNSLISLIEILNSLKEKGANVWTLSKLCQKWYFIDGIRSSHYLIDKLKLLNVQLESFNELDKTHITRFVNLYYFDESIFERLLPYCHKPWWVNFIIDTRLIWLLYRKGWCSIKDLLYAWLSSLILLVKDSPVLNVLSRVAGIAALVGLVISLVRGCVKL